MSCESSVPVKENPDRKKKMTSQKIFNSTSYDHDLLIKTQISAVKNNVSLSIHYLMIATLFGHAVPDYTCKMFCFHRYDLHDLQICVNLTKGTLLKGTSHERKKVAKFAQFLETTMYECSIF